MYYITEEGQYHFDSKVGYIIMSLVDMVQYFDLKVGHMTISLVDRIRLTLSDKPSFLMRVSKAKQQRQWEAYI